MSRNQVNKTIETSRRTLREARMAGNYSKIAASEARHTIHELTRVKAQGRMASAFDTVGDYLTTLSTRRMANA